MLEVKNVSLHVEGLEEGKWLLSGVSARYPLSHFGAIIGPSGCGKTTLLKLIAGIAPGREEGAVHWKGHSLDVRDFHASEIAYVPQFSIAHDELTSHESVRFALALRRWPPNQDRAYPSPDSLLEELGLGGMRDQKVKTLSGGQRRRLALAMELTSEPDILLCDEVTSGLDPQAEDEIVRLLQQQARQGGRLVLSVTHSLAHLDQYDSVLVLYDGVVAYHGSPSLLAYYFSVDNPEQLYAKLKDRAAPEWDASWRRHGAAIMEASALAHATQAESLPPFPPASAPRKVSEVPGPFSQFLTLLVRRSLIFSRSKSQMLLQLSLILGFPLLVAIFAWNGLPTVKNLSMGLPDDLFQHFSERREFLEHSSQVGSVVSGIVMFQVILLTLMGANNSGREIASERAIFEKERLAGLAASSYVASKIVFLSFIVIVQSLWMGLFVHFACRFPGDFLPQLAFLLLVNTAVTSICLGISSLMPTAEQASLVSIYLVGFQLPLSGAVLALPEVLGMLVRPFISAYWSWSGILETLQQERYYDVVQSVAQSPLAPIPACVFVLAFHIVAGLVAAWVGCERHQTM